MSVILEEPFTQRDFLAVMSSADAGSDMLGISNCEAPVPVQLALEKFLEQLAAGTSHNRLGAKRGAMALGSLWGNAVMMAFDWSWVRVRLGDWEALGLVDAERRYLALPHQLFAALLAADCDPAMAGPYVRFKAIEAGHLPKAEPHSYTIITS